MRVLPALLLNTAFPPRDALTAPRNCPVRRQFSRPDIALPMLAWQHSLIDSSGSHAAKRQHDHQPCPTKQ